MTTLLTRRASLMLAGMSALTVAGDALLAKTKSRTRTAGLVDGQPRMAAMLSNTRYFEVDSAHVGARFAIWVTTPRAYDSEPSKHYPAIYLPDGNSAAPFTIPAHDALDSDPIHPIQPFVQICVGYAGDEATRQLAVRARDLLPPGEPLPTSLEQLKLSMAAIVKAGLLDQTGADLYFHNLLNPAAEKFLAFLTEELHPLIAERYRVTTDRTGLFGYSYGGLFTTYAALSQSPLFKRIGAGSPGIVPPSSKVLGLYRDQFKAKADHAGRMLHMTVNELEITAPTYLQPTIGAGASTFIALAGQSPLAGLAFSSRIVQHESHATGFAVSWFSFLRTCYSAGI